MNDGKYLVIIREGKWIGRKDLFLKMKLLNQRVFNQETFNQMTILVTVRNENIPGTTIRKILSRIRNKQIVGIVLLGLKFKNTNKLKIAVHTI